MKKTLAILLAALLAVSMLTACGSSKNDSGSYSGGSTSAASSPPMAPAPDIARDESAYEMEKGEADYENAAGDVSLELQQITANMSEKIIYTISTDIETIDFDSTVEKVYAMLDGFGAFIENSYVGGRNYYQTYHEYQTYRTAWFTLRVPSSALNAMADSLSDLGSVTGTQRSAENITAQYIDTESRLKSYRTQEERLLTMMEKAELLEDMLTIERYLAEVRYQIESLTSQLTNWQNRVDYSTLTLNIREVEKFTEITPVQRSYWQQVKTGLSSTLRGIGEFFKDMLKWLIVSSPVLFILALIAAVIVVALVRRRRAARRKSTAEMRQDDRTE